MNSQFEKLLERINDNHNQPGPTLARLKVIRRQQQYESEVQRLQGIKSSMSMAIRGGSTSNNNEDEIAKVFKNLASYFKHGY